MKKIDVPTGVHFNSELPSNTYDPYSDCDLLRILAAEESKKASLEDFPDDRDDVVLAQLYILSFQKGYVEGNFETYRDEAGCIRAKSGDDFVITEKGRDYIGSSCSEAKADVTISGNNPALGEDNNDQEGK